MGKVQREAETFSPPEELVEHTEDDAELPLPGGCEADGEDWVLTLVHPLSDGSRTPSKIRIPAKIFAKDVRNSSAGKTEMETVFYLLASCSGLSPSILDKLDARDYYIAQTLMNRRALKNSEAVLHALASKTPSAS